MVAGQKIIDAGNHFVPIHQQIERYNRHQSNPHRHIDKGVDGGNNAVQQLPTPFLQQRADALQRLFKVGRAKGVGEGLGKALGDVAKDVRGGADQGVGLRDQRR